MVRELGAMSDKKPIMLSVKLFPGQDDDIIYWLSAFGRREKSAHVRWALRVFLQGLNSDQFTVTSQPVQYNRNNRNENEVYCGSTEPNKGFGDLEKKIDQW